MYVYNLTAKFYLPQLPYRSVLSAILIVVKSYHPSQAIGQLYYCYMQCSVAYNIFQETLVRP